MSRRSRGRPGTLAGLLPLLLYAAAPAGCDGGLDVEDDAQVVTRAIGTYSPYLHFPAEGSNITTLDVCWQNGGFATQKNWTIEAIRNTWERVAWVRFNFAESCHEGEYPIRWIDRAGSPGNSGVGRGSGTGDMGMWLNPTFINNNPFDGFVDCRSSTENRKRCNQYAAVHEFGHLIGLTHEHNRSGFTCTNGLFYGSEGTFPDISVGPVDPYSIMGNCYEDFLTNGSQIISDNDALNVQRIIGGPDAVITSGQWYAVRHPTTGGYLRFNATTTGPPLNQRTPTTTERIVDMGGFENMTYIRKASGSGSIRYGDRVSLRDHRTNAYYCWVDFGSFGAGVVALTSECFWNTVRPGTVGGTTIHVNDPVIFSDGKGHNLPFSSYWRILGPFSPT